MEHLGSVAVSNVIHVHKYTYMTLIIHNVCRKVTLDNLKVWSTVKIRMTRVPQNAIVPVGRPRPYSIIILNMRFIPEASLRASSQTTATSYILKRHLWVNNSKPFALAPYLVAGLQKNWLYYCGDVKTGWPQACIDTQWTQTFVWFYIMLDQRQRRSADVV